MTEKEALGKMQLRTGTLSAALTTGQTLSLFSVSGGIETALPGSLSVTGTSFVFTPGPALVNSQVFNSGGTERESFHSSCMSFPCTVDSDVGLGCQGACVKRRTGR